MTPGEFQYLMGTTKCFSPSHNTFGYFPSKNGRVCQVSTNWNYRGRHYSEKVEVSLYRNKGGGNPWMVKFSDASGRINRKSRELFYSYDGNYYKYHNSYKEYNCDACVRDKKICEILKEC